MITIRHICIISILLGFTVIANAQYEQLSGTNSEKLIAKDKLLKRAQEGNTKSILTLGESQDISLIPILETNLQKACSNNAHPVVIRAYRKALAKLGEAKSREELLSDLDKNKTYAQMNAFEDVVYVGGNDVIRKLASKLYDPTPASRPAHIPDVILDPPRHAAVIALSKLIEDPSAPRIDLKRITYKEDDVLKWREWWIANSNKYIHSSSSEVIKARTPER